MDRFRSGVYYILLSLVLTGIVARVGAQGVAVAAQGAAAGVAGVAVGVRGVVVSFNDPQVRYVGRVAMKDSAAQLAWPGTSVSINFFGTGVSVVLNDERGDNYYNVILDNKVVSILHPDAGRKTYTLVSGLPVGKHFLELFKRTEWTMEQDLAVPVLAGSWRQDGDRASDEKTENGIFWQLHHLRIRGGRQQRQRTAGPAPMRMAISVMQP